MRDLLTELGRQRVEQGFTPSETAAFVFSFKQPLFARIGVAYASNAQELQDEIWTASELLDKLGLYTIEVFQRLGKMSSHGSSKRCWNYRRRSLNFGTASLRCR